MARVMDRNKKLNPPPQPPNTAAERGGAHPPTNNPNQQQTKIDQELSLIKSECLAAIAAHIGGNPAEAFRLMEETRLRYENCGLVYASQYKLHALEASRLETSDGVLFQKHLRSAVDSARRAVSLSPNSTEFETLYVQALNKLSSIDVEEFHEVCERGLSIENPLQHFRDASLSLKAMVWDERSASESSRMSERKKQAVLKEIVSATAKMGKSRAYWDAMSDETKLGLVGPRIGDLREYYSSVFKDGSVKRAISESIGYVHEKKNWKNWPCYYCDEKFEDYGLRMKHVERKHEEVIGKKSAMRLFLFQEVDADSGGSEVYHNFQIKDHGEVKDPKATNEAAAIKATSSDKLPMVQEEKTEQADFHVAAASADELKLEERLDHQRQFEEEAKQKALAKETTNEAAPTKATTVGQEDKAEQA